MFAASNITLPINAMTYAYCPLFHNEILSKLPLSFQEDQVIGPRMDPTTTKSPLGKLIFCHVIKNLICLFSHAYVTPHVQSGHIAHLIKIELRAVSDCMLCKQHSLKI